jgi:4-amino-4-deoxy-L-arabinose transferase-like glycosyltransferase
LKQVKFFGYPVELWLQILVITGIVLAITGWLGIIGLTSEEPRRALVSLEMFLTGNYRTPHLLGWYYYNKPPLFNWVQLLFIKITGSYSVWALRLPSILSLLMIALINWKILKIHINRETAWFSSIFILTSGDVLFFGSVYTGEIDLFYALLVYIQIISVFHFLKSGHITTMFVASYLFTALGFLTKGPPSLVFQGFTLIGVFLVFKQIRLLFSWKHLLGVTVFAIITGLYLLLLYKDGILKPFLIRQLQESFQRTAMETTLLETIRGFFITPFRILLMLLPWSLFIVYMARKDFIDTIRSNRLVFFSALFILFNLPLYWITGDFKGRYIYPFFPFFCTLFGYYFTTHVKLIRSKSWLFYLLGSGFILMPIATIAIWFIPAFRNIPMNHILNLGLIIIGILLAFLYVKMEKYRIYLVLVLLVMARLGENNIYLKSRAVDSPTAEYKLHVENMLTITGGQPVFITGTPNHYPNSFRSGFFNLSVNSIQTAPYIAFQVPYYLALKTGELVRFETEMQIGVYYLIDQRLADEMELDALYRFQDGFIHITWFLVTPIANADNTLKYLQE